MSDFLASELEAFLGRRAVPQSLSKNPTAQATEVRALLDALKRHAPKANQADFWEKVVRYLDERASSRAWPMVSELVEACKECRPREERKLPGESNIDSYAINARRIQSGEAVGDEWLYGRLAIELVQRGLVTDAHLAAYRSGMFFAMKDVWGEEKALIAEADFKAKHEAAKMTWQHAGEIPQVNVKRIAKGF